MATQQQPPAAKANNDVRVEVIEREEDIVAGFDAVAEAFGVQTRDSIWISMNPGWDDRTPGPESGRARCAAKMVQQWRAATSRDRDGNLNTVFLKATVPDPQGDGRVVAGFAIWFQASFVPGRGDPPTADLRTAGTDVEALHPGNESEQRFVTQVFRSLFSHRVVAVQEKADKAAAAAAGPDGKEVEAPAMFLLDLCAVHPDFQRRGIASALVRWGLEEARRREVEGSGGHLELAMEASVMGRLTVSTLGTF